MAFTAEADPLRGTAYHAIRKLGQGSMGVVLEAKHTALGRACCVKLLLAKASERAGVSERFRVEAQALAQLEHPNIVQVTDLGQTPEGRPFFVMERLRGMALQELLKRKGYLAVADALSLFHGLLDGLQAAHEIGVVHRDIKPANLFICDPKRAGEPPRLKILDFGVTKLLPPKGSSGRLPAPAPPTEEGLMVGTPKYMAPEQALGKKVDERIDIYAAGAVLYYMVAGRGPFDDLGGPIEIARAHIITVPEPPSRYAVQPIPSWLDEAILRALEKRSDDRFPSVRAFGEALRAPMIGGATARPRASPKTAVLTEFLAGGQTQKLDMRGPTGTEKLTPQMHAALANVELLSDADPGPDERAPDSTGPGSNDPDYTRFEESPRASSVVRAAGEDHAPILAVDVGRPGLRQGLRPLHRGALLLALSAVVAAIVAMIALGLR